jgi:cell division protein FtsX
VTVNKDNKTTGVAVVVVVVATAAIVVVVVVVVVVTAAASVSKGVNDSQHNKIYMHKESGLLICPCKHVAIYNFVS